MSFFFGIYATCANQRVDIRRFTTHPQQQIYLDVIQYAVAPEDESIAQRTLVLIGNPYSGNSISSPQI